MATPFVIGLTGGVASGKSEASAYLEKLGAQIVDADKIAREAVELPEIRRRMKESWPAVFDGDNLDRAALRRIVFSSREERERLNGILHPTIVNRILRTVEACEAPVCVVVAPLLIEAGLHQMVDEVWVVDAPEETQISRLIGRDNVSREDALLLLASQLPAQERLAHANRIIDNSGTPEQMRARIDEEWKSLKNVAHH